MRLCLIVDGNLNEHAPKTLESWRFVQQMLADLTPTVTDDATDERELLEGLQGRRQGHRAVLGADRRGRPRASDFFDMCRDTRMIGGPNPDGRYLLAMIRGDRAYRVTGTRGTTAYLGFQVLAGTGLTPRRMAAYLSDTELDSTPARSPWCSSAAEPPSAVLGGRAVGRDPGGRVVDRRARVRRRLARRAARHHAHRCLDPEPLQPITDAVAGRAVHRDGVDHRQADHTAPHHQARAAHAAQRLVDRRGRRTGRRRHHPRQPVHDRYVRAGARRVTGARVRSRPTPATGTSPWRTSGTNASSPAPAQLGHRQRRSRRTTTGSCGSPSAPRTSVMATGWTPVAGAAASSSCDGSTTLNRPRCTPRVRRGETTS